MSPITCYLCLLNLEVLPIRVENGGILPSSCWNHGQLTLPRKLLPVNRHVVSEWWCHFLIWEVTTWLLQLTPSLNTTRTKSAHCGGQQSVSLDQAPEKDRGVRADLSMNQLTSPQRVPGLQCGLPGNGIASSSECCTLGPHFGFST